MDLGHRTQFSRRARRANPRRPPGLQASRPPPYGAVVTTSTDAAAWLPHVSLGRMAYAPALAEQERAHAEVLASRDVPGAPMGRLLTVEHPPVITVTNRPAAPGHVLTDAASLHALGIDVQPTDRGGDVTYHGPGQLVVYPIVDLKRLGPIPSGLGVHDYIRAVEQGVIHALAALGLRGERDPDATGVWIRPATGGPAAKVCAIGVRVRRWVTMHGLALNVCTDLSHFDHIVPCGLAGRPVTSIARELGNDAIRAEDVAPRVVECLAASLLACRGA